MNDPWVEPGDVVPAVHAGVLFSRRCSWVWFARGFFDRIDIVLQGGCSGSVAVTMVGPKCAVPGLRKYFRRKMWCGGRLGSLYQDYMAVGRPQGLLCVSEVLPNGPACEFEGRVSANPKGVSARR